MLLRNLLVSTLNLSNLVGSLVLTFKFNKSLSSPSPPEVNCNANYNSDDSNNPVDYKYRINFISLLISKLKLIPVVQIWNGEETSNYHKEPNDIIQKEEVACVNELFPMLNSVNGAFVRQAEVSCTSH